MGGTVHAQVLLRAAQILGGNARLRAFLRVSMADLETWMLGKAQPPSHVFLRAVDLISAPDGPAEMLRHSKEVRRQADLIGAAARLAREHSVDAVKRAAALREMREIVHARRRPVSAEEFVAAQFPEHDAPRFLEAALNAAVGSTAAKRGNVQVVVPGGLRIVAHLGFERPFLDYFALVSHDTPSTCGRAHQLAQRVIVEDVPGHPIFAGTHAAQVMERAGALACQSTPLVDDSGVLIGMLNTHYEAPHHPTADELQAIDTVSKRTASWLAGTA